MNELAKTLTAFLQSLKPGVDFVLAQAPLVVQEKILLARLSSTFWTVVGLTMVLVCVYLVRRTIRKAIDSPAASGEEERWVIAAVASGAVLLIGCTVFLLNLDTAMTAWLAPRVYILEWIGSLVK